MDAHDLSLRAGCPVYSFEILRPTGWEPGGGSYDWSKRVVVWNGRTIVGVAESEDYETLMDWVRDEHPEAKSIRTLQTERGW